VGAQKWRGIEARSINRFMRLSHADLILTAIAAGLSFATTLNFGGINFTLKTKGIPLALFAVPFAVGGWWTARTWNRVWRWGQSDWERLAYDYGVRTVRYSTGVAKLVVRCPKHLAIRRRV
jgi:hypothetical protein